MNSHELLELARHSRYMREAGVALLMASALLALFLFVPLSPKASGSDTTPQAVASASPFPSVDLHARAVIVYDLATGETLYAQNADSQLPLASLTKLLSVYTALTVLPSDTPITISEKDANTDAPRALNIGQTFALADLARITLTASLNDGAAAIIETTAARENQTTNQALAGAAAALDLSQTYAVNGSGLDVSSAISGGYGSARDLARLAGEIVRIAPAIADATTHAFASAISLGGTLLKVKNTDPIISEIPHLLLSKTGFTDLAGGNLALVFDAAIAHPIAVVVLGASEKTRFSDAKSLVVATLKYFADHP